MLYESFLIRHPSLTHWNGMVKAVIVSETFVWGSHNLLHPIFALFVTTVPGGTIEMASIAFSSQLLFRVVFNIVSGRLLLKTSDVQKYWIIIAGICLLSILYFCFIFSSSIIHILIINALIGAGLGIISPARSVLFSMHIDKDKATVEWGAHDAIILFGAALAAMLGGYIANSFGFKTLFIMASLGSLISIIPYSIYFYYHQKTIDNTP